MKSIIGLPEPWWIVMHHAPENPPSGFPRAQDFIASPTAQPSSEGDFRRVAHPRAVRELTSLEVPSATLCPSNFPRAERPCSNHFAIPGVLSGIPLLGESPHSLRSSRQCRVRRLRTVRLRCGVGR